METVRSSLDLTEEDVRVGCVMRGAGIVELERCLFSCSSPCKNLLMFRFVVDRCLSPGCSIESPCEQCQIKIHNMKLYIRALRIYGEERYTPKLLKARLTKWDSLRRFV